MGRVIERAAEPSLPLYESETSSVRVEVIARGVAVIGHVTGDWLRQRFGPSVADGPSLIDAYLAHAGEIDQEVARRYLRGRSEPIWLASAFPPIDD